MERTDDFKRRPTTKWVKGELHSRIIPHAVDPKHLLAQNAGQPPFNRLDWFERVVAHWHGECRPLIAHAWNEGHQCWLFLAQSQGGQLQALSNWYSMAVRPIFSGETDPTLLVALARRLKSAKSVSPMITLHPVPRADGSSDLVLSCFRKAGWIALRHQSSTSWTATISGKSFDAWWAERPGQLRSTFQRKSKKSGITTEILTAFEEGAWQSYESVYGESWKTAEGSPAFLRDMAEAEGKIGGLRLGLARLDGAVVAAQFWTVTNGIAYIHKLAHREEYRDLSPGTILSEALFRHVIDVDKVAKIDFGTGNDTYKADWMDRSDPLDTIRLFKKNALSGLIGAARARISALVRRTPLD
jgi:Acetyltransferase (GNAT) domain